MNELDEMRRRRERLAVQQALRQAEQGDMAHVLTESVVRKLVAGQIDLRQRVEVIERVIRNASDPGMRLEISKICAEHMAKEQP